MPMTAHEIEDLLRETFPHADIQVGGSDGVHMSAMVIDESFRGKKPRATTAGCLCRTQRQNGRIHWRVARPRADNQSPRVVPSIATITFGIIGLVVVAIAAEVYLKRNRRTSLSSMKPKSSDVRHHATEDHSMTVLIAKNDRLEKENTKRSLK